MIKLVPISPLVLAHFVAITDYPRQTNFVENFSSRFEAESINSIAQALAETAPWLCNLMMGESGRSVWSGITRRAHSQLT